MRKISFVLLYAQTGEGTLGGEEAMFSHNEQVYKTLKFKNPLSSALNLNQFTYPHPYASRQNLKCIELQNRPCKLLFSVYCNVEAEIKNFNDFKFKWKC